MSSKVLSTTSLCRRLMSSSSSSSIVTKLRGMMATNNHTKEVPPNIVRPPYIKNGEDVVPAMPEIKSSEQIEAMRPACRLAASILKHVKKNIQVGMTTENVDEMVHSKCVEAGAYPSPLQYKGFPKSVCTSVNHVACHGIPSSLVLQDGDIINVDISVFYHGYHGDTSSTFMVGDVDKQSRELVKVAEDCCNVGIQVCKDGVPFVDIATAIHDLATKSGFDIVYNVCGHGIGTYFHGPPNIIHFPCDYCEPGTMTAGMTFTVEPIICAGSPEIEILNDGWTVISKDKERSAQFEHTILITHDGYEILTMSDET